MYDKLGFNGLIYKWLGTYAELFWPALEYIHKTRLSFAPEGAENGEGVAPSQLQQAKGGDLQCSASCIQPLGKDTTEEGHPKKFRVGRPRNRH
jgi:hypothetical protein